MGNKLSSSLNLGGIVIEFDKPFYYPGNTVSGNIYIDLKEDYHVRGLDFTFETIEYTNFLDYDWVYDYDSGYYRIMDGHDRSSHPRHRTKNKIQVLREGKRILYTYSAEIAKFKNNRIIKGNYIIPFTFIIPLNLPGSFEYYDESSAGYIKYIITTHLRSDLESQYDIVNSNILMVRQNPGFFNYPHHISDTKILTGFCFLDKGRATLNASCTKFSYSPNEKIQVVCEIDNTQSLLNAKSIQLELFQNISLKSKAGYTKYITRKITEAKYELFYVRFLIKI